ncbi:hypothetical protein HK100_008528 [Physocladia obscura]|uniref:Extracellular membrane protein CFEM domain-containing protein n=1 Tax=Physocladia obscura TaxID=109957 RepID=A0AAD5T5S3_9FUNG|nr:hypothetical protein HK100_008528 [Physocladia obscura]
MGKFWNSIKIGLVVLSGVLVVRAQSSALTAELACLNGGLEMLPVCYLACLSAQDVTLPLTFNTLSAAAAVISSPKLGACAEIDCTTAADETQLQAARAVMATCVGFTNSTFATTATTAGGASATATTAPATAGTATGTVAANSVFSATTISSALALSFGAVGHLITSLFL